MPHVLIKWGTSVAAHDPREAERSFLEALRAAEQIGDEMYLSMALQRLGSFYWLRDLRKAAEYNERARHFIRKVRNTGVFFQAASAAIASGHFQKAEDWIAEGERQIAGYPDILNRVFVTETAHRTRAMLLYSQGHCSAALQESAHVRNKDNLAAMGVSYQVQLRRMKVCASPQEAARHLIWIEERRRADPRMPDGLSASLAIAAGEFALRIGKWEEAKRSAEMGLAACRKLGFRVLELQNLLVLRAAEMRLGNREQGLAITQQIQQLAPETGIGSPPDLAGRYDLKLLGTHAEPKK